MTTATWNLGEIRKLTRQVSGQLSAIQLPNDDLDFNINSYYQWDLPRELKTEELYTQYTFPTIPNVAVYDLPGNFANGLAFTHTEPAIFIDGQAIFYTQDTNIFYRRTPILFATELMGTGDGLQTVFPYTVQFPPIVPNQPASVNGVIQVNGIVQGQTFSDDGLGNLIGSLGDTGTVVYATGALTFTYTIPPPVNSSIFVTYHFNQVGRPTTCLFYARQFTLQPCPDNVYQVRIDAYLQPQELVNTTDVPIKNEWGEIIGIGAALKIVRNFGQMDKYQEILTYYRKERSKVMSDTDNQLMASRSKPTI